MLLPEELTRSLSPGKLRFMTQFTVEFDREDDGRWIAEIPALPGALVYGASRDEALRKVESLALRILADRTN